MTGFDRLKEQISNENDEATIETINYLLSRKELEQKFLNEEKSVEQMREYIARKCKQHLKNGWTYVKNEVVFSWAVAYFTLPQKFLDFENKKTSNVKTDNKKQSITKKKAEKKSSDIDNVISLEDAKKKLKDTDKSMQLSMFGGEA